MRIIHPIIQSLGSPQRIGIIELKQINAHSGIRVRTRVDLVLAVPPENRDYFGEQRLCNAVYRDRAGLQVARVDRLLVVDLVVEVLQVFVVALGDVHRNFVGCRGAVLEKYAKT